MAGRSSPPKKIDRFIARATPDEVDAFTGACKKVGLQPTETLRQLAAALVAQVKTTGTVVIPIKLSAGPSKKKD